MSTDTRDFRPHTAIVTASDSGMGRATAVALARAGLDVGVTWHSDEEGARETARLVEAEGRRAVVAHLDVTDIPACGDVIDALAEDLGGVDVFVNNAGTGDSVPFLDVDLDSWRRVVVTDLEGAFVAMQRAARRMVSAGRGGRIVGVTSVHEHQPKIGSTAYDAAKHGLGGLLKTMAIELAEHGITVNAVAPGLVATPMTGIDPAEASETRRPGIPIPRPGVPEEIAAVIAFLCSPSASYVTGASWPVDGGMLQMGPMAGASLERDDWRRV
ncbi:SDR family oxidoreductase [Microbacterium sp. NPDC003461]